MAQVKVRSLFLLVIGRPIIMTTSNKRHSSLEHQTETTFQVTQHLSISLSEPNSTSTNHKSIRPVQATALEMQTQHTLHTHNSQETPKKNTFHCVTTLVSPDSCPNLKLHFKFTCSRHELLLHSHAKQMSTHLLPLQA